VRDENVNVAFKFSDQFKLFKTLLIFGSVVRFTVTSCLQEWTLVAVCGTLIHPNSPGVFDVSPCAAILRPAIETVNVDVYPIRLIQQPQLNVA